MSFNKDFDNSKADCIKNNTDNDSLNDKFDVSSNDDLDNEDFKISDPSCDKNPPNSKYSPNMNFITNSSENEKKLNGGSVCITPPNCNYTSAEGCGCCPIISEMADIDEVMVTTYRL